jgi:acyl-CoA synthetase (AMP-forming)/AMP-acid ligase II
MVRARVLAPLRPDKYLRMAAAARGGGSVTLGFAIAAQRCPDRVGLVDELGSLSWRQLFVVGRDDVMIVSGGENVYPIEVEKTLMAHPDVAEASVVGVADDQYGQRLVAFVVMRPGATTNSVTCARSSGKISRTTRCCASFTYSRNSRGTPPARS